MCSESENTRQRPGNEKEKFKMSAEEDTELRDMVAQTLESKGVLGKIRVREYAILNNVVCCVKIMAIKLSFHVVDSIGRPFYFVSLTRAADANMLLSILQIFFVDFPGI